MNKQSLFAFAFLLLGVNATALAESNARLDWSQRVALSTTVSGVVSAVNVNVGDMVRKGDVLLLLDQRGYQAGAEKARAEETSEKLAFEEAERELQRAEELYERTVLSDVELSTAKIAFSMAEAKYAQAKAKRVNAELALQYSEIRAPFNGVVVERSVEPGQTVVTELQSVPMLVVADSEFMVARATVSLKRVEKLKKGQSITVKTGGQNYIGEVISLGMEPVANKDEYVVEVRFSTKGKLYRKGQEAELVLP